MFNGFDQAVARLAQKAAVRAILIEQCLKTDAAQCGLCGQNAHDACSGYLGGRLDAGLNAHQWNGQLLADKGDGLRRRRIAGDDQRLGSLRYQPLTDRQGPVGDEIVIALAIRCITGIGDINQSFVRKLRPNGPQHGQAP